MPLTCLTFSFIQWLLLMDQWSQQQQESSSSFGNMLSGQQQKFQQHQRRRRRSAILPPSSSLRIYYEYLSMIYLIVEYSISLLSSTSILSIKSMYHRKFGCHSHHHDHHRHHSIDHQFQFFHYNQWPNHHCNHHVNNCNYNRINKQSISSKCCFTSIFLIFLIFLPTNFVNCGSHERRLLNDLLSNYNVLERPVANESEVLIVYFSLTLQQIIDVDEKNQNIITNMWLRLEWNDSNLRWSPNDYGGITDLRISPDKVWRPDILLYNSADEKFDGTYHSNVVVTHTGSCLYIPPGIFKSTCKIDITWFPFDDQFCNIKFGSWTYYGSAVDLRFINETSDGDISPYIPNGEWVLLGVPGQRNVQTYECCPEQYIDITYTIGIRRRTLYYGFNLIVPSVIISSMTLLSFTLPPDSGEKLTLGVTILLSMIVFMMQLAEIMPATSDSVSIVGSYFACIMVMVAFSVVMTVVVLNFHHRTTEQQQEMPKWIRKVIITWLPMILRIKKPPELLRHEQSNNSDNHISNRNIIIDAANNNNSNNNNNPTMTTSILMTNQYNNNNNRTITSSLSSPTHLELIRLTAKMKEYESLCHKHDCIHRNNKYQQQMSYESMIHSNRQTSGICPWNTFSAHIPPSAPDHIHDHMQQSISPPFNEQSFLNQQPQQQRRHCGRLFETTNPVIHHFDHHHQSQQPQQSLDLNPCCCCMCTGTGTHQTIDYFDSIMQELRFITNRYRREDDLNDIISEWKYAAIVIDRLCLIVFSTFAVLSLVICLASAPHLLA